MRPDVALGVRSMNRRMVWGWVTQASAPHPLARRAHISTSLLLSLFGVVACDSPAGPPSDGPSIALSEASKAFSSEHGGAPASQTVLVTRTGGGTDDTLGELTSSISYSAGDGWLTASLSSTTAPSTLTLTATPGSLAEGTYTASVAVNSRNASNGPRTISVTLSVGPALASPIIKLSSATLSFSGSSPVPQTVSITNGGGGALSRLTSTISYTTGHGWLTASLSSTTAPSTLTVTATPGSLAEGTYTASVAVSSGDASNSPQQVSITVTVEPATAGEVSTFAAFDNGVAFSGRDPSVATQVLERSELGVGCIFLYLFDGTFSNYTCFGAALKFDIQGHIRGRGIRKATLRLSVLYLRGDFAVSPEYRIQAFADSWSPTTLNWSMMETLRSFQDPQVTARAPNSGGFVDHDVTGIVQNWASGTWSNEGLSVMPVVPATGPGYPSIQVTFFESLEANRGSANRPQLIIEFE